MGMWSTGRETSVWSSRESRGVARPITRGRIALEIEAAEIYFRNVEIRALDVSQAPNR